MRFVHALLIVMVLATTASAQPGGGPVLAGVVNDALKANPEITSAEQRYAAARLRPIQERSLPDPMVSAGYNASGKPFPGAGLGTEPIANIGAMGTQELPYPGKRGL